MKLDGKIFVAGHRGLVGSAVVRKLKLEGYTNLLLRSRQELDLTHQSAVFDFFEKERPEYVILCAARVGGIVANMNNQADFLYNNLMIQNNVIWSAKNFDVKKLLFLGSSCIYPRNCEQPMKEEYLLTGLPEPTNEGYALAKIAGMKLCEQIHAQYGRRFISCMPTNMYGINDNFDAENSHVIPGLIQKIYKAKMTNSPEVKIWGTGVAKREFMYADDLADAVLWLMINYEGRQFVNVGTGDEVSIKELAFLIKELVGYDGAIGFDSNKPDGMPRKLLDLSKLHSLGWRHSISLREGLRKAIDYYISDVFSQS